jgi:teichuronic acid exporter
MQLKKKALNGIFWNSIQQFSTQGVSFGVSIILARLLTPTDFGLIAMVSFFINFGNSLIESGLNQSLLRMKEPKIEDYSTVFFLNLIFSLIIFIIILIISNNIASFYNQPILAKIIRIYSIVFILNALTLIQITRLTIQNNFKSQLYISIPSILISSIIGITLAYLGYGIWSLVWNSVLQSLITFILIWTFNSWRPILKISYSQAAYHFKFGYKLTLSSLLETFFSSLYSILIGKFFSPSQVGFFQRADSVKQLPITNIISVINKVTYPLLAQISDDRERLKVAYKNIISSIMFLVFPILAFMYLLAVPLFRVVFTDKWLPAVPYFQILCISGVFYPVNAYMLNILTIKGQAGMYLKLEVIKKIVFSIIIIASIYWGIIGLLYGAILFSIISYLINSNLAYKYINYGAIEQITDLIPIFTVTSITMLFVYIVKFTLKNYDDWLQVLFSLLIGVVTYLCASILFKLKSFYFLREIYLTYRNKV